MGVVSRHVNERTERESGEAACDPPPAGARTNPQAQVAMATMANATRLLDAAYSTNWVGDAACQSPAIMRTRG